MNPGDASTPAGTAERGAGGRPLRIRVARQLYRALLPVLPASIRRRHGDEMLDLFVHLARDAERDGGRRGLLLYVLRSVGRLLGVGVRARWSQWRSFAPGGPGPSVDPPEGFRPMHGILHDIRHGLRSLRRSPGYVLIVVVTLALAVATNTTIFSMVKTVLMPPIPFTERDTLVFPVARNPELKRARAGLSMPDMEDLRQRARSLEDIAAQRRGRAVLAGPERPARVDTAEISRGYFELVGVEPRIGRLFVSEESVAGNDRVLLLSHGAWERRFGADPGVVGTQVAVDGVPHTVVGVMPEELRVVFSGVELFRPLPLATNADREERTLSAVARLAPGATLERAREELLRISRELQREHPDANRGWELTALGFSERMVGPNVWLMLTIMTLAVGFVLAIACVNVANLTMARATHRRRELSLRMALGARRWRVIRELLIESTILALLAGVASLLVTRWIFALMVWLSSGQATLFETLRIDPGVLLFALGLSLLTPVLFGLWPALRSSSRNPGVALRSGGRGAPGAGEHRVRRTLVVGQVALAMALLVVAGLLSRSLYAMISTDLGFDPGGILTFRIQLSEAEYSDPDEIVGFYRELREGIAALSGVIDVGLTSRRPVVSSPPIGSVAIEGRTDPIEGDSAAAATVIADPGYFRVLGAPLLQGRWLESTDGRDGLPVALVSRAAMKRYWPGSSPIGARIRLGDSRPWRRVVGVVGDLRNPDLDQPPEPYVYVPFAQSPTASMAVMLRAESDTAELADAVRGRVWSVDPGQPIDDMRTMEQIRYDDSAGDTAVTSLLGVFAIVAFVLAVAGIYGVVSYSVSQRTREIGIRMAMGARAEDVRRLVTRQGLTTVLAGVGLGLLLGFALSRVMAGSIYGISPLDPVTFIGIPLVLSLVGLIASLVPAGRAARLDPARTLQAE